MVVVVVVVMVCGGVGIPCPGAPLSFSYCCSFSFRRREKRRELACLVVRQSGRVPPLFVRIQRAGGSSVGLDMVSYQGRVMADVSRGEVRREAREATEVIERERSEEIYNNDNIQDEATSKEDQETKRPQREQRGRPVA